MLTEPVPWRTIGGIEFTGGTELTGGSGLTGGKGSCGAAGGMTVDDNGAGVIVGGMFATGGIPADGAEGGGYASRIATVFFSSTADFFCLLLVRVSTGGVVGEVAIGGPPIDTFAPTRVE